MRVFVCAATGTTDAALKQRREENHRLQMLEAVAREANESHTRRIQQLAATVGAGLGGSGWVRLGVGLCRLVWAGVGQCVLVRFWGGWCGRV